MQLSMVIPVYNEACVLEAGLEGIITGLSTKFSFGDYEVVLVENGSTDGTRQLINQLASAKKYATTVSFYTTNEKGLGLAYKKGIELARFNNVLLSAIDLPFGFSDVNQVLSCKTLPDLIFFSKAHRDSVVKREFSRTASSFVLNKLLRLFFSIQVGDTQGTVYLNRYKASKVIDYANDPGLFFTAQLGIYATKGGLEIEELPITMDASKVKRKSKFHPVKDGVSTIKTVVDEIPRYSRYAKT